MVYWTLLMVLSYTFTCITKGYHDGTLEIYIKTGDQLQAETKDDVYITINGTHGTIEKAKVNVEFDPGFQDGFELENTIGTPYSILLHKKGYDNWYLDNVNIAVSGNNYTFICRCWFNRTSNSRIQAIRIKSICENQHGDISCNGIGQNTIKVMNGMYGRFDLNTCPHDSIKEIGCYENGANTKITELCEGKHSCSLKPNSGMFYNRDPCESTYKYAMVAYDCGDDDIGLVPTMTTEKSSSTLDPMSNRSIYYDNMYSCSCMCDPQSYEYFGCHLEDIECVTATLRKQLFVDVETLSAFTRKKTSATDLRTSSRMIGGAGVLIILAVVSVIVVPDTIKLFCCVRRAIKKANKS